LADGPLHLPPRPSAGFVGSPTIPPAARGREREDNTARRLLEVDRIPRPFVKSRVFGQWLL
jgi:hypothetical protein